MSWSRAFFTLVVLTACALAFVALSGGDEGRAQEVLIVALLVAGPPSIVFTLEPERLPGHVALPRGRARRLLLAPFLRGGGRGAIHLVLNLSLALGTFLVARALFVRDEGLWADDDPWQLALLCAHGLSIVLFPALLSARGLAPWPHPLLLLLPPALLVGGFALGVAAPDTAFRAGDPFRLVESFTRDGRISSRAVPAVNALFAAAALALVLNAPRMARGLREVLRAPRQSAPDG